MLSFKAFPYEGKELRTVTINGEIWFVASDVCAILGLSNTTKAIKLLRSDEKTTLTSIQGSVEEGLGQNIRHNATLIRESGLYRLIMRSDKPGAKVFQDWVVKDVLPTLRKTGSYTLPSAIEEPSSKPYVYEEWVRSADITLVYSFDKGTLRLEMPEDIGTAGVILSNVMNILCEHNRK